MDGIVWSPLENRLGFNRRGNGKLLECQLQRSPVRLRPADRASRAPSGWGLFLRSEGVVRQLLLYTKLIYFLQEIHHVICGDEYSQVCRSRDLLSER